MNFYFSDVLVDVKVSSRDFQHEILPAITKSYRHPQSNSRFVYDHVQLVQNPELTNVVSYSVYFKILMLHKSIIMAEAK